jgi:hypothetical protein
MILFLAAMATLGAVSSAIRCVIAVKEYRANRDTVRLVRHGQHLRVK